MSGKRIHRSWIGALILFAALISCLPVAEAAELQLLPAPLVELLPANTVGVVLAPAFDQMGTDLRSAISLFNEDAGENFNLRSMMEEHMPGLTGALDTSGPMVLAIALPTGGPGMPTFTLVGRAQDAGASAEDIVGKVPGAAAAHVLNGFVGLSSDPAYAPALDRLTILDEMPAADLSARIDLETVVTAFGPMLRALLGMGMAGAAADSTREFDIDASDQQAIIDLVDDLLESAKTLDLAVDYDGQELVLRSRFETREGSPLAPGPQPDFGPALELARWLPRDHTMFGSSSMNLDAVMDFYREFMEVATRVTAQDLPEEMGSVWGDVVTQLLAHARLYTEPLAWSVGFDGGAPEFVGVLRSETAGAEGTELLDALEKLTSDLEMVDISREPFGVPGGWQAERIEVTLDLSDVASDADPQTQMVLSVLQALIPSIYWAQRDDLCLWMATDTEDHFLQLAARVDGDSRTKLPPALESAMEWSGPGTQLLYTVEARGLINSALDLLRGFMEVPLAEAPPVRLDGSMHIEGTDYAGAMRLDLQSAAKLVHDLMEVFQRFDDGSGGPPDEDSEASLVPDRDGRPSGSISLEEAAAMAAELQPAIEEMRGHSFVSEVPVAVVSDAEAREYFADRMKDEMPVGMLEHSARVYHDLGMLEDERPLMDQLLDLLEEQAGGFYDPSTGAFYMLDDMPRSAAPIIMVHELTHALDDQTFDLDQYLREVVDNNDALSARGCVGEGSGMLTMTSWLTKAMMQGRIKSDAFAELGQSQAGQAEKLRSSAPVIANALMAPYLMGQRFLGRGNPMAAMSGVPSADIDQAFTAPPLSMEQILHPEKYWEPEQYDRPKTVDLPEIDSWLDPGFELAYQGVLGELDLASLTGWRVGGDDPTMLVSNSVSTPAASGWDGDQFSLYRSGERSVTVVGLVFDDESEAEEFSAALHLPPTAAISVEGDRVAIVAGNGTDSAPAIAARLLATMRVED